MRDIFRYQVWHALFLIVSITLIQIFLRYYPELTGELWGISTITWFWVAIAVPIIHQIYVLIIWRLELYHRTFTKRFGLKKAFKIYSIGFSGRLAKATRVDNNLAYAAYSYYSGTRNYGFYRIVSQTSIGKKDKLVDVLKHEVQRLIDGDIKQEEIDLSVESYAKMLDSYFTDNKLVGTMTSYESRGLGYNFLKESLKELRKVTPEIIKEVANKYLKNAAIIISQPSADVKRVVE